MAGPAATVLDFTVIGDPRGESVMVSFTSAGSKLPGKSELLSWMPALGLSTVVGLGSLTQRSIDWPFSVDALVGAYHAFVYPLVRLYAESASDWMIDVGALALGGVTLLSRLFVKFLGSAVLFAAMAAGFLYAAS